MPRPAEAAELVYTWWERFLNAQSALFGGDREFTELSSKLHELRTSVFADRELTPAELDALQSRMQAVAALYTQLAQQRGIALDASAPISRETLRAFREAAEIHFQTLAGDDSTLYRGGLLAELLTASDPDSVTHRIALDILCSATEAIAVDKVYLVRAQLSLLGDGARQRALLDRIRKHLAHERARPVWGGRSLGPAIEPEAFDRAAEFKAVAAVAHLDLPAEVAGTNQQMPNRPFAGWPAANRAALRSVIERMRSAGRFFLDQVEPSDRTYQVSVKLELNLGIEGPPSVTDPALTHAVIAELLEQAERRGVHLRFSVGDSNGIENAPVGRTSMDVMWDTGNYHMALKAALEYAAARAVPGASEALARLENLERENPPVYFGSSRDHVSTEQHRAEVEAAAERWVVCIDHDEAGFREIQPDFGPLAKAIWGSSRFQVAEPWVSADFRVHVTRAVSNHTFAGWTGALKGLVGLHALGGRPADRGMQELGMSPLDVLSAVMRAGSFTGLFATRVGIPDFGMITANCGDGACLDLVAKASASWNEMARFAEGRRIWKEGAEKLEAELRSDEKAGEPITQTMLKMRQGTAALLRQCELASPGFRASLDQGIVDGTRAFLLTTWLVRNLLPPPMRDERMGLRIGLLSRLPYQADFIVQGMPKIGLGGGPDAYFEVRDVGVVIAGTDEISVDLVALREAGVDGNPWAYHHPIHGALQFGRGPMCWDEIQMLDGGSGS